MEKLEMPNIEITTCEFILEVESAARESRRKAAGDVSTPIEMAYYQTSLELRRIVDRHIRRGQCAACRADERRSKPTTARVDSGLSHRSLPHSGLGQSIHAAGC